ncbi:MAG: VWA domain-containing protein, partial [Planctomycetota bacterium]|nr:VWA domain-containing protein [Planctomycetota bacterium]
PFARVDVGAGAAQSDLASGLWAAARAIPAGRAGAITLVTDGLATAANFGAAMAELTDRGLPLFTLELPSVHASGDPRPVGLAAHGPDGSQSPLRVGARALVDVTIADAPATFDLTLRTAGSTGAELCSARFTPGPTAQGGSGAVTARLEFEPSADMQGFLPVVVSLDLPEPGANLPTNDSLTATLAIHGPQRVLHLGGRVVGGGAELADLVGAGFALDSGDASTLEALADPARAAGILAGYDAVVLDDLAAADLPPAAGAAIEEAVRQQGLGLFASGGVGAFGPGGWHDTVIEDLLPVELVQKEEKRDPSTTLVVIIDSSGSMGGNRVQLAKEVARLAIRRLLPHDKVGLVEFYGAKRWAAPIQPASNAIEIERALNRLNAGGGTVILPAIEEAFYGLKNVRTRYKHVLILTDGGVETGSFEPLLRSMAEDGINTSTVLIGPDAHSEFLVTLSNWGKGRFYSVPNRFNLPEILLKQPTTAKLPAWRPGPHRVRARGGPSWWDATDVAGDGPGPDALPDLGGYVETRLRPGAQVLVETEVEGHPVLATWETGLGRVTAFTTEPAGAGTDSWSEWDGLGPLLARALERTSRTPDGYDYSATRDGYTVLVRAQRRSPAATAAPRAALASDGEAGAQLAFAKVAPGLFEARVAAAPDAELRLLLDAAAAPEGTPTAGKRGYLVLPPQHAPELNVDPAAGLDLQLAASLTGGSHRAAAGLDAGLEPPAAAGASDPVRRRDLRPLFLLLTLLTYLFELLYRRLDRRPRAQGAVA